MTFCENQVGAPPSSGRGGKWSGGGVGVFSGSSCWVLPLPPPSCPPWCRTPGGGKGDGDSVSCVPTQKWTWQHRREDNTSNWLGVG